MLSMRKMTTRKGHEIQVHFEDPRTITALEKNFDDDTFERRLRSDITSEKKDAEGVHVLVNSESIGMVLTKEEYETWRRKAWFHRPPVRWISVGVGGMGGLMAALAEAFGGGHTPPTDEQVAAYKDNEKAQAVYQANRESVNCALCLRTGCPVRHASFDATAFAAAVEDPAK